MASEPGVAKTAAWSEQIPLGRLAELGYATGTTVNDVCTALVASAFAR
ncbi:hypothetical protein AB0K15_46285 [Amycolatopsis sp. NPDC049253]